ncbi:hypothetical protein D3C81_2301170 [compost metagenome]
MLLVISDNLFDGIKRDLQSMQPIAQVPVFESIEYKPFIETSTTNQMAASEGHTTSNQQHPRSYIRFDKLF